MKFGVAVLLLAAVLAGCDEGGTPGTLTVLNDGLHWALVELSPGPDGAFASLELQPGHTVSMDLSEVGGVDVQVSRLGDGLVVFHECYSGDALLGNIKIVVRP